jgi:FkbM family methyltransferase
MPVHGTFRFSTPVGSILLVADDPLDLFTQSLFWAPDAFEPETIAHLPDLLRDATVFVDVGAHNGAYSLLARAVRPGITVHAFEPAPSARARLERNLAANDVQGIIVHSVALGDRTGVAPLYVTGTGGVESSLLPGFRSGTESVEVRTATLDAVGIPRVDVIKIDTEGTEAAVIRGAAGTIQRDRPLIVCEVLAGEPTEADLPLLLDELGYLAYHLTARGLRRSEPLAGDPSYRELNFLLAPREVAANMPSWMRGSLTGRVTP